MNTDYTIREVYKRRNCSISLSYCFRARTSSIKGKTIPIFILNNLIQLAQNAFNHTLTISNKDSQLSSITSFICQDGSLSWPILCSESRNLFPSFSSFKPKQYKLQIGSFRSRVLGLRSDRTLDMPRMLRNVDCATSCQMFQLWAHQVSIMSDTIFLRSGHSSPAISKHLLVLVDLNTLPSLDISVPISNTFSLEHQTFRRFAKLRLTLSTSTNITPQPTALVAFYHYSTV